MDNSEYISLYQKQVFQFLEQLKPGTRLKVSRQCKIENRKLFIACIKEYMDSFPYQGFITFNKDYSEFYKSYSPINV